MNDVYDQLARIVGPDLAGRTVEVFGERTAFIVEEAPTFLTQVEGMTPLDIARIRQEWEATGPPARAADE